MTTPSDAQPVAWRYRYKRRSDDWDDWIVVTVDPNDWRNLPSQWTDFQCEPLYTAASLASARADGIREGVGVVDTLIESLQEGLMTDADLTAGDRIAMRHQVVALDEAATAIRALINKDAGGGRG